MILLTHQLNNFKNKKGKNIYILYKIKYINKIVDNKF